MNRCNYCRKRAITYGLDSKHHVGRCDRAKCTRCDELCGRGLAARIHWDEGGMEFYADVCYDHLSEHPQMFNPHLRIEYYTHLTCEDDPGWVECEVCARRDCPYGDASHYESAGCLMCFFLLRPKQRKNVVPD